MSLSPKTDQRQSGGVGGGGATGAGGGEGGAGGDDAELGRRADGESDAASTRRRLWPSGRFQLPAGRWPRRVRATKCVDLASTGSIVAQRGIRPAIAFWFGYPQWIPGMEQPAGAWIAPDERRTRSRSRRVREGGVNDPAIITTATPSKSKTARLTPTRPMRRGSRGRRSGSISGGSGMCGAVILNPVTFAPAHGASERPLLPDETASSCRR